MSKPATNDAVKEEIRQQNKNLMTQRDQYYQKFNLLEEELNKLKNQKKDLMEGKKSHQQETFLKENDRLQMEIQNKIKAVRNVIDMLSKIIKVDDTAKTETPPDGASTRNNGDRGEMKEMASQSSARERRSRRSRSKSRHRSRSRHRRSRSRSTSASRTRHKSRSRIDRSSSASPKRLRRRSRSHSKDRSRRAVGNGRYRSRDRNRERSRERRDRNHRKDDKIATATAVAEAATSIPANEALTTTTTASMVATVAVVTAAAEIVEAKTAAQDDTVTTSLIDLDHLSVGVQEAPPLSQSSSYYSEKFKPFPDNDGNNALVVQIEKGDPLEEHSSKGVNYVHYDPEIHWCHICNVFPATAKEYLLHLHDVEHKNAMTSCNMIEYPWHSTQSEPKKAAHPDWPTERVPIRGLPFFVSAMAWYCKLCCQWMGDLHCASAHLKSDVHEEKFKDHVAAHPDWEEKWLRSRAQAREQHVRKVQPAGSEVGVLACAVSSVPPFDASAKLKFPISKRTVSSSSSSSSSTSGSSSSSSSSSTSPDSKSKLKKKLRNSEKKYECDPVSKEEKHGPKATTTTPQLSAELKSESTTEKGNHAGDDKFVEEWLEAVRQPRNEKELIELKNKLKKRESEVSSSGKKPPSKTRHSELSTSSSRRRCGTEYTSSTWRSKTVSSRFDDPTPRKILDKPIVIAKGKFPFIGKMPSKSAKKAGETESAKKVGPAKERSVVTDPVETGPVLAPEVAPVPSPAVVVATNSSVDASETSEDNLASTIRKQLAELGGGAEQDSCNMVVDMDINDDDDGHNNEGDNDEDGVPVVDDNANRRKDFEATLKILYPDENKMIEDIPLPVPGGSQLETTVEPIMNSVAQPMVVGDQLHLSNVAHDYLYSLIESTLIEKFKTKLPGFEVAGSGGPAHVAAQLASTVHQALLVGGGAAGIGIGVQVGGSDVVPNVPDVPNASGIANALAVSNVANVSDVAEIVGPNAFDLLVEPSSVPSTISFVRGSPFRMSGPSVDPYKTHHESRQLEYVSSAPAPPAPKKKKNPISQKKRRHLRKIREKLEAQEKQVQAKIEATKINLMTDETQTSITKTDRNEMSVRPITQIDSDMMLLGIDEADSAALFL